MIMNEGQEGFFMYCHSDRMNMTKAIIRRPETTHRAKMNQTKR